MPSLRIRKLPPLAEESREPPAKKNKFGNKGQAACDPLQRLNEDTINLILHLIPSEDLVRLERVSTIWRAAVRSWIEVFGIRTRFPSSWIPAQASGARSTPEVVYDTFKQHARREYLMLGGRPTEATKLYSVDRIASAGDYIAWSTLSQSTTAWEADEIYLKSFARTKKGSICQPISFSFHQLLGPRPRANVYVEHLSVNEDGVLLLQIRAKAKYSSRERRDVVYSPGKDKVLWSLDIAPSSTPEQSVPVMIGKSSIYCVNQLDDRYTLSAYDFRSGKLLYHSPNYASSRRPQGFGNNIRSQRHHDFQILRLSCGRELIVSSGWTVRDPITLSFNTILHIIDGETGKQIYNVTHPDWWRYSIHVNLITNRITLTWSRVDCHHWVSNLIPPHQSFAMVQTLSYGTGEDFRLSLISTDIMLASRHMFFQVSRFDPSVYAGLCCTFDQGWQFNGYTITPTTDEKFMATATGILHQYCARDQDKYHAPTLNQCFIINTAGDPVTLPKRPKKGRFERVKFDLPEIYTCGIVEYIRLTDNGFALLGFGRDAYVFKF
ncbi:hypothetical protein BDW59DRAFT_32566 [Aspergillus cavernicola]|uniref:F-box domain-containing protein n=1 Tax=Aspergillus cavernicola TaxID=176166 RepID=A0ABR4IPH8_9EURO